MDFIRSIKSIFKFKNLFYNFSIRSFANLVSKLMGLITLPIIARALGPESYGNYNLVNIVLLYTALPMAILGLRSYGIREIAAKRKETSYANDILSMQFSITLVATLISLLICFFLFENNYLLITALIFGYVSVFARSLDLEFFYVSQKNLAFPTYASLFGQVFYVIGVILFIKSPSDFPLLVFLGSITIIISDIIQIAKYHKQYHRFRLKLKIKDTIETFKKTFVLGISQNLEGFIPTIPQILLPIFASVYALGIVTAGMRIYAIIILFYSTFFYALAPYLVQMDGYPIAKKKKYHLFILGILIFIGTAIGLLLYFLGEPIVLLLLGKGFGESIIIFKIISITLIPIMPIIMLFGNILIYSGNEKYYLYSLILNGIVTLLLSYFLISKYQAIGAVYVMIFASIVSLISLIYFYYKIELVESK